QMHIAFLEYSQRFHDACPIGYVEGYKQMDYMAYRTNGSGAKWVTIGLFRLAGLMKMGQMYYCPTRTNDSSNGYNVPDNLWPAKPTDDVPPLPTLRIAYAVRPAVEWTNLNPPSAQNMPRLTKIKNRALIADLMSNPFDVQIAHKKGVNVLYGNGSAVWVPLGMIQRDLDQCTPTFSSSNDIYQDHIWDALDRGEALPVTSAPPPR
ncbi:MAG TPA: hypothetical protein VH518_11755, partial [Tepidisphaeraceae bacterium]